MEQPMTVSSLALLSSSGTDLLADAIRTEWQARESGVRICQSGFNQYRQDLSNADSAIYRESPDIVVLHLDAEDLFADCVRDPFNYDASARLQRAQQAFRETERYVAALRDRLPQALVIVNTLYLPPIHCLTGLEYHSSWGLSDLPAFYNRELARTAQQWPNVIVSDVASLVLKIGYNEWFDPRLWYLARSRLSGKAMKALASQTASVVLGWKGQSRKCLVVDLDNTLWGGVIGEDGLAGIILGEEGQGMAFAEFQQELQNLSRKGILLAICSKNNEEDALEVLQRHPSMRLRKEAFAARRINWQDKATNLRDIAAELSLGLDAFVLIDDNPAERSLVKAALPEVLVPDWPQDPTNFKSALLELAFRHFPRVALTAEDQLRTSMYRAHSDRRSRAISSGSLEEYYRSLDMRAEVGCADEFSIPRIAQLCQKTNQFNLTNRRYTEAEIRSMASTPDVMVVWLRLRDRFLDDGIVAAAILRQCDGESWVIDTFLMSCRVIGRTVENALLGHVCNRMRKRGARQMIGEYVASKKNSVVADLYQRLGFEKIQADAGITRWRFSLEQHTISIPEWIEIEVAEEKTHA